MSNQLQQKKVLMRAPLVFSCLLVVHLIQGSLGMAIEGGTCPPDSFMCMDGSQCVEITKRCDGSPDCPDGTDEYNCEKGDGTSEDVVQPPEVPTEPPSECAEDSFRCKDDDSKCVPQDKVCDGTPHCSDASDEKECIGKCNQPENFLCHDGRCMTATVLCNGHEDCSDGSDESNCTSTLETTTTPPDMCTKDEHRCPDGTCMSKFRLCDGRVDCHDGSDELIGCSSTVSSFHYQPERNIPSCSESIPEVLPLNFDTPYIDHGIATYLSPEFIGVATLDNAYAELHFTESSGEQTSMESLVLPPPVYKKGNCSSLEFHCLDDTCIPISLRCDTNNDCPDGSDELQGCTRPLKCRDGFICPDGHCIPVEWQCDGSKDCLDGSDEMNCNGMKANRTRRVPFGLVEEERIKNLQEEREFRMEIHQLQLKEMQMKQDVAKEELTAVKSASEIAEALAQEQLKIAALERQAAEDKVRQQSELYQLRREAVKPEQATPTP